MRGETGLSWEDNIKMNVGKTGEPIMTLIQGPVVTIDEQENPPQN